MSLISKTRIWYGRYERPVSSLSLILGFVFDIVTLKRVDTLWENLWIIGHILIVGIFIALIHIQENESGDEKNPEKRHFWYVNILQFFFGGLLSTFLVFYFRSTDIFAAWPFILLLVFAFIANESLKRHYIRFSFQISLFFLSIYSFFIFLIPIILHKINAFVFLLSGLSSLLFITIFIKTIFYITKEKFTENKKGIVFVISGIFILVNILYFTNLIPPIPLSLKDADVYYSIYKNNNDNYIAMGEDIGWRRYFQFYKDFKQMPEYPIYAYSAVFSPKNLNIAIFHKWQYYDKKQKKWITDRIIKLKVEGGRDGGFRTYSMRYNLAPGKWRVNIETEGGQNIGRIRINMRPTQDTITLKKITL